VKFVIKISIYNYEHTVKNGWERGGIGDSCCENCWFGWSMGKVRELLKDCKEILEGYGPWQTALCSFLWSLGSSGRLECDFVRLRAVNSKQMH
jgi:hypothetical protein